MNDHPLIGRRAVVRDHESEFPRLWGGVVTAVRDDRLTIKLDAGLTFAFDPWEVYLPSESGSAATFADAWFSADDDEARL